MSIKTLANKPAVAVMAAILSVICCSSCAKEQNSSTPGTLSGITVGAYPSYQNDDTKSAGTVDAGKKAWEAGDVIYLMTQTGTFTPEICTLTYNGTSWDSSPLSPEGVKSNAASVYYEAVYAPAYTMVEGELVLKPGKTIGTDELFKTTGEWAAGDRVIRFTRNYSRIRVAVADGDSVALSCNTFHPVGLEDSVLGDKSLGCRADANGNAFFYGTMPESSRITVRVYSDGKAKCCCYFDGKTLENGKSYAFNPQEKERTLKVMAIGNSFSADAVEQELYGLFEAVGQKIIIGEAYIGGCPLDKHAANAKSDAAAYSYRKIVNGTMTKTSDQKLSTILKDEAWDVITVQEGAGYHGYYDASLKLKDGTTCTHKMEPNLTYLIDYSRNLCPNKDVVIGYHAPWAAQKGCTSAKFDFYNEDQKLMYDMICSATQQALAAHPEIGLLFNSMDAVQSVRTSYIGDNMCRDGWHMSYTRGRYTVGCLWFERLTGINVIGNPYHPATISAQDALVCQTAAHEACKNPYMVADLSYFEGGGDEPEDGKRILAKWKFTPDNAKNDGYAKTWMGSDVFKDSAGEMIWRDSNQPGERGYILANDGGSGKLSYVQVDKTKYSTTAGLAIFNVSNGGQPVMRGAMRGDYWQWETTSGKDITEGTKISMTFTYTPSKYGSKYWMVEYKDGDEWKPAFTVTKGLYLPLSGETIDYNLALTANKIEPHTFTFVLENPVTDIVVRMTCQSEYQVNDKWFDGPRTQSEQRIAGDPANPEKPCPEIAEIFN